MPRMPSGVVGHGRAVRPDHDELARTRPRSTRGSRARTRVPPSPCTSTSTSPSRWSAARTSPRSYGTTSSTIGIERAQARRRRVSSSSSTPSPVDRRHRDDPGCAREQLVHVAGSAMSALLSTSSSGTSSAPISREHRRAPRRSALGVGRRARRRRAPAGRRRRPLRASTGTPRPAGAGGGARSRRCRSTSTVSPPGSRSRRVVGSRVENRRSSTSTSASVSRLSSVDLPAFV